MKKEKIFSHIVKSPKTKRHTVEKNLDALRRMGIFPNEDEKDLKFVITHQAKQSIQKILSENNILPEEYVLIHPTTRWRFKCWDKFDQLIKKFYKNNQKVIVVSGKATYEIQMVDKIIANLPVVNLAGKVTIDELACLISMSKTFYCLDSLSFHLANSLKANVKAFFGPTCDITWGSWKDENAQIIASKMSCRPCSLDGCGGSKVSECLKAISVDEIKL